MACVFHYLTSYVQAEHNNAIVCRKWNVSPLIPRAAPTVLARHLRMYFTLLRSSSTRNRYLLKLDDPSLYIDTYVTPRDGYCLQSRVSKVTVLDGFELPS